MIASPEREENEEKETNVVTFEPKLITGGKEPPEGGDNWLSRLPVGSCFLAKKRAINPTDFNLGLFRIGAKTDRAVVLNTPDHPGNLYVNPAAFCNMFVMYEDLGVMITPEEEEQEKEEENERDRDQSKPRGSDSSVE